MFSFSTFGTLYVAIVAMFEGFAPKEDVLHGTIDRGFSDLYANCPNNWQPLLAI